MNHKCDSNDLHLFVGSKPLTRSILSNSFKEVVLVIPTFFTAFTHATYEYSISGKLNNSEFNELAESLARKIRMNKVDTEDFSDFEGNHQVSYFEEADCNDKSCLVCFPDEGQSYAEDFEVFPWGWDEIQLGWNSGSGKASNYLSLSFLPLQNSDEYMLEPDWEREDLLSIQGPAFAESLATINYLNVVKGNSGQLLILIRDEHDFRYFRIRTNSFGSSLRIFFEDVLRGKIDLNRDIFPISFLKTSIHTIQRKIESCEGEFEYLRTSKDKEYYFDCYLRAKIVASYKASLNIQKAE